jgi:hypothetical protein
MLSCVRGGGLQRLQGLIFAAVNIPGMFLVYIVLYPVTPGFSATIAQSEAHVAVKGKIT